MPFIRSCPISRWWWYGLRSVPQPWLVGLWSHWIPFCIACDPNVLFGLLESLGHDGSKGLWCVWHAALVGGTLATLDSLALHVTRGWPHGALYWSTLHTVHPARNCVELRSTPAQPPPHCVPAKRFKLWPCLASSCVPLLPRSGEISFAPNRIRIMWWQCQYQ